MIFQTPKKTQIASCRYLGQCLVLGLLNSTRSGRLTSCGSRSFKMRSPRFVFGFASLVFVTLFIPPTQICRLLLQCLTGALADEGNLGSHACVNGQDTLQPWRVCKGYKILPSFLPSFLPCSFKRAVFRRLSVNGSSCLEVQSDSAADLAISRQAIFLTRKFNSSEAFATASL